MKKPKIFCQFVDRPCMEPISGDRINEIRFYRALSTFADVFYNDHLIDWESGIIGHPTDLFEPSRDYDLYYIRANPEMLKKVPGPTLTMAYPYSEEVFNAADAVAVTTSAWQGMLLNYNRSAEAQSALAKWYPAQIVPPKHVINIRQTIDPDFLNVGATDTTLRWRATLLGANAYAFFGRVSEETIPYTLVDAVRCVREEVGGIADPIVAFAGSIRTKLPADTLNLGQIEYGQMPAALRACAGILGQECPDSGFLGSGKVLDGMAVGVPIVSRRNQVREEQLGVDYPGLFTRDDEAYPLVRDMFMDCQFAEALRRHLRERREIFLPRANGGHIYAQLRDAGLLS